MGADVCGKGECPVTGSAMLGIGLRIGLEILTFKRFGIERAGKPFGP